MAKEKREEKCHICNESAEIGHGYDKVEKLGDVYVCSRGSCGVCRECSKNLKKIVPGRFGRARICPTCLKKLENKIRERKHERVVFGGKRTGRSLANRAAQEYVLAERERPDGKLDVVEAGYIFDSKSQQSQRIIQSKIVEASETLGNHRRGRVKVGAGFRSQYITTHKQGDDFAGGDRSRVIERISFWLRALGYRLIIKRDGGGRFHATGKWDRETLKEERARTWASRIDEELGEKHQAKLERIDARNKGLIKDLESFIDDKDFDPEALGIIEAAIPDGVEEEVA
jgi:hypothetical protein